MAKVEKRNRNFVKKQHIHKMSVTEMRMLRWIRKKPMKDRTKNFA